MYAVVEFYRNVDGDLRVVVVEDGFRDIKLAEKRRSEYLEMDLQINPQNIQVTQYDAS